MSLCRKGNQRVFVCVNHNVHVMVSWSVGMMEMMGDVNSRDDMPFLTLLKALGCPMLENMSGVSSQESMVSEYRVSHKKRNIKTKFFPKSHRHGIDKQSID